MSSAIWTRCAAASEAGAEGLLRPLSADAWRVVEAQHLVSTRKLVDSDEEQSMLEDLLEASKPPPPADAAPGLHWLLTTPFRYPPLRYGSRYGRPHERSLWYGALELRTAFAEVAYYRLLFLDGTAAELTPLRVDLSAFQGRVRTHRGVDLTRAPFEGDRGRLRSRTDYRATQALGSAMREAGVEVFLAPSARDPEGGANVGVFTPRAFGRRKPTVPETWHATITRERVELQKRDFFAAQRFAFDRNAFTVRGKLPSPAA